MDLKLKQFINQSNLSDEDKLSFFYLVERLENKDLNEFTDRSFLFEGDPGIGKTYFVKNLLSLLEIPVIYLGPFDFNSKNIRRVHSLKEILESLDKREVEIIFIDDLNNSLDFIYDGMGEMKLEDSERKRLLKLLDLVRELKNQKILFTTLNDSSFMEESWQDRIERKITMEEPNEKSKKIFLKEKYSSLLNKPLIKDLSQKTVGYNFRNLEEVIKIGYREGKGIIKRNMINSILSHYKPSGLKYELVLNNKLKFNDVIGNEGIKQELSKISHWIKNYKKLKKYGVKRANLLIFSGKNGVGKTHMATALAGELDCMLVKINVEDFYGHKGLFHTVSDILKKTKRFRNCIFFIDEADKIFGRDPYSLEGEGPALAEFSIKFDNLLSRPQGIVVFAVNNVLRMGNALKDRFNIINFDLPKQDDRSEFIKRMMRKCDINLNITPEEIASSTEGYNYRDLEKLWNDIIFYYIQNNTFNSEVLRTFISTQQKENKPQSMFG